MGLSGALLTAISGLRTTQVGVDLVAQNIANADTPGYTRKSSQQHTIIAGGDAIGVRSSAVTREINSLLLEQSRIENGEEARLGVLVDALSQLDLMFGVPGGANSLDGAVNEFASALQDLSDSPESAALRSTVIEQANVLASKLNSLSSGVQTLRQQSEYGIASAVASADGLLDDIAAVNQQIARDGGPDYVPVDLLDQRDRLLGELSQYMDIRVQETNAGTVRVFTGGGHLLVDGSNAMGLAFDANSSVGPGNLYSQDPSERSVGTVYRDNGSGQLIDLFSDGGITGGIIGGYRELRDETLVQAQAQLDELAHGLATTLSAQEVASTPVSVGTRDGFDLDIGALQPGDSINLTYTQTPPGTTHEVTIIRVDDASALPLENSATANPNDTVIGLDFSGGVAGAIADLDIALGSTLTASNPSGTSLRLLDDGAAGAIEITGFSATVTATGTSGQGLGLALFSDGAGGGVYSGSLDGDGQKLGFAGRITINPAVVNDDTSLVLYDTGVALGDQSRPDELLRRLSEQTFAFSPSAGIGSNNAPVNETIGGYARRVITEQTGIAASAQTAYDAQSAIARSFDERIQRQSGVDVDGELANLITLQNAYAANARVISVVQELFDTLNRI